MRSLKFPNMFNSNSSRVWKANEYLEATKQNTALLLECERGELFGDPYFGVLLKHYMFEQNSYVLKDIIIDIIYNQLAYFIPQVKVERENIDIIQDKKKGLLICNFSGINQIDYKPNTFSIKLIETSTNS